MPVMKWEIQLDGASYKVVLNHSIFTGEQAVRVNGRSLPPRPQGRPGGRHPFQVNDHACEVVIEPRGETFAYNILVDGKPWVPEQLAPEPSKSQNLLASWGVALMCLALGIGGNWFNWYQAHTNGSYFSELALFTPPIIFLGIYILLFPKEVTRRAAGISVRMTVVMGIGFLFGLANLFAFKYGLY